jgi:DNA-binding beta-propeller fold protein YncE
MNVSLVLLPFLAAIAACTGEPPSTVQAASGDRAQTAQSSTIQLPGGEGGIGLDDLRYSRELGRVLVPAGRTGKLDLVDPVTGDITAIGGFGAKDEYAGGHGDGTTSVDEDGGLLFAIDRSSKKVVTVDPKANGIVAGAALAADPDYVRYVAATNELWVTEPDAEQIEIFRLSNDPRADPQHAAVIAVKGGPESLVIDAKRGRAFAHLWSGTSVAIDLHQRAIVARWPNGCSGSRGIALDEARGFLFVGCAEGRAVVLDVDHDGKELSHAPTGSGVDIIDYDAQRGHLYIAASKSATLTILGLSGTGALTVLGTFDAAKGSHQATTDGSGRVFVGDPNKGRLIVITDPFPPSVR